MEQYIQNLQDFMVLIRCYTFNHSEYITDTLNGFTMQQTNFPFIIVLVDDASTDGEQNLIKQYVKDYFEDSILQKESDYAHLTFTQHKTNQNCYLAVYYLKENHYSKKRKKTPYLKPWRKKCKYEALCEGDDYWIDPLKLKKQVDFLERHPDYSLCFHNAVVFYDDIPKLPRFFCNIIESRDVSLEEITDSWIIPTASMLYRRNVIEDYPQWTKQIYSGDLTLQLIAYSKGKLYYMNQIMSFYRMTYKTDSASSTIKGKADFVYAQHALLYKLYDEYTNYIYHDILSKRIDIKEKKSKLL